MAVAKYKITLKQLRLGCAEFRRRERRDAIYKTATFLVEHFWDKPPQIAEGLGVLLLVWNNAFYRNGPFDFDKLEACIDKHHGTLASFRRRTWRDYCESDDRQIGVLFRGLLPALEIAEGTCKGRRSPVGVVKALHLLAPQFFPLWDEKIARAYGCFYKPDPVASYSCFMRLTKDIAAALSEEIGTDDETLLKMIDEYNYALHTKAWIEEE